MVSIIGGGNWSTRRKPPTCRKSLTTLSHNAVSSTLRHELAVHRRRTNNTMAKSRWTKNKNNDRQKTLHRKLEIEQHEPR